MEQLQTPLQITLTVAMVACLVLALWRGGPSSRLAAGGMVLGSVLSALVQDRAHLEAAQWIIMGVDAAYLALLLGLAWRSPAAWLIWAAAFQLAQTITHVSFALNPEVLGRAYVIGSYVLFAALLCALFAGLWPGLGRHDPDAGAR